MDTLSIGKHNPRLLEIRKAIERGTLTSDGLLPIEGPRLIAEARKSGLEIVAIFARKDAPLLEIARNTPVLVLEPATFRKIQDTETSQGIVALVRPRQSAIENLFAVPSPLMVLMDGLQDPGNVGTILRSAESFGASGCIGLAHTAGLFNPKVVRASAGSAFRLPWVTATSLSEILPVLRAHGVRVVATSPHGNDSITTFDWRGPTAFVIGNEGQGMKPEDIERCDAVLKIPQQADVESFNSAVAASVILYEAFRQRGGR